MRYGVLGFSYFNFHHFAPPLKDRGYYTSNLGDSVQTIASREAFIRCGVASEDIIEIDRDTLPTYSGPPAVLLMNGVFSVDSLPAPPQIRPIFLGFNSDVHTISQHADWLRHWEPIGCRDPQTAQLCREYSIDAFVTGCVTITLPRRDIEPANGRLHIVFGWDDLMPSSVMKHVPHDLLDNAVFMSNRHPEKTLPLTENERLFNQIYVADTLRRYREEASIVLTPLLHVSSPCIAMGIPTIVCRNGLDTRFGHLQDFVPIYTPQNFQDIDWSPRAPNVDVCARKYLEQLRRMMEF